MNGVLVNAINPWRIVDDQTGEIKEGVTIHYLVNYSQNENGKKGIFPFKESVSKQVGAVFTEKTIPALCDLETVTIPDSKGKPKQVISNIKYLKPHDIFKQ